MSPSTLRIVISVVLIFHGVGHIMGIIPAVKPGLIAKIKSPMFTNWSAQSWLLTNLAGNTITSIICVFLFAIGFLGFLGAGLGIFGKIIPYELWRMTAIAASIISLLSMILYWNAFILLFPHKIGAIAVNLACLILLAWMEWPSDALIGN